MKVKSDALPRSRVEVDTIGGKTTVTLWDGEYTEHEVEEESGARTEYEFALYQIQVPERPGLASAVEANFEVWLAAAKRREEDEQTIREVQEMEKELLETMPEKLLELDFDVMMMKEFGGAI